MPTRDCIDDQLARFYALGYPGTPAAELVDLTAEEWLEVLGDMPDPEFVEACRRYKRSPDDRDRFFPQPARIIALSPTGRAAAFLGSDEDCEQAFEAFTGRMRALAFRPDREDPKRHLDPGDPYRNDAMFAALSALTPGVWWGDPAHDRISYDRARKAWISVYRGARKAQSADPAAVQLTASSRKLLLAAS